MSEEKPFDITTLGGEALAKLTDDQVSYVVHLQSQRRNGNIHSIVKKAMEGREREIMEAMLSSPCIYVSPDIELATGLIVRYQTLLDLQQEDIWEHTQEARLTTKAQITNTTLMGKLFVAHSLAKINGEPFAGREFGKTFWDSLTNEYAEAKEKLVEVRNLRLKELSRKPLAITTILYDGFAAFQTCVDDAIGFKATGDKDKDSARINGLADTLGKSPGPERAGQTPT